jgi:predicted ATP-dependent serine protease
MSTTVTIGKRSFTIKSAADAFIAQTNIDYIMDKFIAPGWITLIYGHPGAKKTWIALVMAACIAIGKVWLTFNTIQCKVLWLDEECGENSIARRIKAVILGILGDEKTPIDFMSLTGFKFDNPKLTEDCFYLTKIISDGGYKVVFIDALADIMNGDENTVEAVRRPFQNLKFAANATGAAIVLIHHSNKAGSYRGSSFIKGFVDVMIHVESDNGSDLIRFSTEKIREDEMQTWSARAVWDIDRFFLQPALTQSMKSSLSVSEVFVIKYLDQNGSSSVDDIASNADTCSDISARKAVYELAKKGITCRIQAPGKKAIYDLTIKGMAEAKLL